MNRIVVKKIIIGIGIVGYLLLIGVRLLYTGYLRFNYPSLEKYPVRGIDVSHHQHTIDWSKVKQQNIQFAFIKATEGGDFKDKAFMRNWDNARSVGIDVGAYHFFTFCKSGSEQAENFIETVPINEQALPPVIDLEFGGNCRLKKDDVAVLAEIDTLLLKIESAYHKKPILYVTQEFYEHFLIGKLLENPIWIRDIYREPSLEDNRKWLFWQFANRGHLDGISTYVDFNVFNGTEKEYQQLKRIQ